MQISYQVCFAPQNLKNPWMKKYITTRIVFAESDISELPARQRTSFYKARAADNYTYFFFAEEFKDFSCDVPEIMFP